MPARAVVFDLGETLIDETRIWAGWADWLGVPRLTFLGVLGGLIERGEHHLQVFEHFRPGFDLAREEAARDAAGVPVRFDAADLYPDVRPALDVLYAEGYRLGIVGNQPPRAEADTRALGLPVEFAASSAGWGLEKPAAAFFARVAEVAGLPPQEIAYVGDRVDNDVVPAAEAGFVSVFLRRGPWGYLQAEWPSAARAHIRLDSLADLPGALRSLG